MAERKTFFKTRGLEDIVELNPETVSGNYGEDILEMHPGYDARFINPSLEEQHNAFLPQEQRKNLVKRGEFIQIRQGIPKNVLAEKLSMKEEHEMILGYELHPDPTLEEQKPLRVLFSDVYEGNKLFAYSERLKQERKTKSRVGISIEKTLSTRKKNARGFETKVSKPWKGQGRETITIRNVPVKEKDGSSTIRTISFEDEKAPVLPERYLEDLGNHAKPESIAAYLHVAKTYHQRYDNPVPYRLSPFPIYSERMIEFFEKLENNLVINAEEKNPMDTEIYTDITTYQYRKPTKIEKSILAGKAMTQVRDPFWQTGEDKIFDYKWNAYRP